MNIVKTLVLVIVAVVATLLIAAYSVSPEWEVESHVKINGSTQKVFPYINTLNKWPEWTVWNEKNYPNMSMRHSGPESGSGAVQSWNDGTMEGKLELTDSQENNSVQYHLDMDNGTYSMDGQLSLKTIDSGTEVTWRLWGNSGQNPFNRIMMLMYKPMIESDLEGGLHNLKSKIESS